MRRAPWVIALACACGTSSDAPPMPSPVRAPEPPPAQVDAGSAGSAMSKAAISNAALDHMHRVRDAFDRAVADPANRGSGWTPVDVGGGSNAELYGLYADGSDLLAVGADALIVRSRDGGATWTHSDATAFAGAPLLSEVAGAGDRRYAISPGSVVGVSADRGATWTLATIVTHGVAAAPAGLFAAGSDVYVVEPGHLDASHDRGATWAPELMLPAADDPMQGLHGVAGTPDGHRLFAYGQIAGKPFVATRTADAWHPSRAALPADGATLTAFAVAPDGTQIATLRDARAATMWLGGDRAWTPQPRPFAGAPGPWWVAPDGAIYAAVTDVATASLQVSRDRGHTWTHELPFAPRAMAFTNTSVFAVGYRGTVWSRKSTR
nr:hypothetical protein [Kofleriaceae bacterium]